MGEGFSFSEVSAHYFNEKQLESLRRVTVGIAGAGGIGSNCAIMLVRSGFSRLVVADYDRVTASNLNRQAYSIGHIGRLKVECLREICAAINPAVSITPYSARIDKTTLHEIFGGCDAVVEAFDDPAGKALVFSEYLHSGKLLVGVSGIAGIGESDRIIVRKIGERCYIVGDGVSTVSEALKPHAPRVMVAAAKMADIVLAWALSRSEFCG
ncbi:MAG: sulfur carrier protein ThiS adenylyltransferase ThiF [Chitinispirillaceae bacterium]|nr:sulfur carrier protein ThiS adenylyltransferase ThiF [Chitinispirillaceae bacterium]